MTLFDAVVIPAAGAGSRFHDLGKQYPKCCLPYQEKPIIRHIVENTMHLGKEVRIITSNQEQEDAIRYALELNGKIDKEIKFFRVDLSLVQGPATSLYAGLQGIENAVVFLSDAIPSEIPEIKCDANYVYTSVVSDWSRWCMVHQPEPGWVMFYDKPKERPPTLCAACGVYVIKDVDIYNKCFLRLQTDKETQFSDVFKSMMVQSIRPCSFSAPIWTGRLLDFGTLPEYIANKEVKVTRSFNNVNVSDIGNNVKTVTKTSTDKSKLMAEATFIAHQPEHLAVYYPRVLSIDSLNPSYTMEYIYTSSLRDMALFMDKSYGTWSEIFQSVRGFISLCAWECPSNENSNFWEAIHVKNMGRLYSIMQLDYVDYNRDKVFLNDLNEDLLERFGSDRTSYHGDLHFANMFYDFNTKQLKLIDPRGEFTGHWFYDLAKLYHSVVGKYDYIDSELYSISSDGSAVFYDKGCEQIQQAFHDVIVSELDVNDISLLRRLTASLFLSMIPLHKHNPTNMRLFYKEYERLSNIEEKQ